MLALTRLKSVSGFLYLVKGASCCLSWLGLNWFCVIWLSLVSPLVFAGEPKSTNSESQSLFVDIVLNGDRLIAVGERGQIIYSDNQGLVWITAQVPSRVLLTAVFFVDANTGWAVGHNSSILHSNDGGETWVEQYNGRIIHLNDKNQLDDSGSPFLDLWFKNANEGFVVGAYGRFLRTNDGGKTWLDWSAHIDNEDGWHLNRVAQFSDGALLMVGEHGVVYRSRNEGYDWQSLSSPYEGSLFGIVSLEGSMAALIFGSQGKLYRTQDQGDSWTPVDSQVSTPLNSGVLLENGTIYIVGNNGVLLQSSDNGNHFSKSVVNEGRSIVGISAGGLTAARGDRALVWGGQGGVRVY